MITTLLVDFFGVIKYSQDDPFSEWNEELLKYFLTMNNQLELFIFTSSLANRDKEVQSKLKPIFKEIFSAIELGVSKKDPNTYKIMAEKIGKQVSEVLFIDDTPSNIETAKKAGMNALIYTNLDELKTYLLNLK